MFDYLVVGAGFAGCVVAERLARVLDRRVLCSPSKVQPIAASPFFFCPNGPLPPLCNCEVLALRAHVERSWHEKLFRHSCCTDRGN